MTRDLYIEITDKIVAQLESGTVPWVRPWAAGQNGGLLPFNYASKKPYRGINIPLLWANVYPTNGWLTFKQAQDLGAHVRKGERGSMIVFYKPFQVEDRNAGTGESKVRFIPLLRHFTVFNVAQIDGLPESNSAPIVAPESNYPMAESLLTQASIRHGGDRAFYAPSIDAIQLPFKAQFNSEADYYATALHELTHWTGASSRLAREYGKRFGDQAYAREELVAEMGAAFLCAACEIPYQLQHASYIQSWINVLKADKRAVVMAAGAAQKAADLARGINPAAAADDVAAA